MSLFACASKRRLSTGTVNFLYVFARLQLSEQRIDNLQPFEESDRSQGCFIYSTIRKWHCEFKTEKRGNNAEKPNGCPKSASNEKIDR